jgi:threonyl-tRNA synthetase
MRLLILHVDSFTCTITEKGRSPLVEPPTSPSLHIDAGLLVLASVERGDEAAPDKVAEGTAAEIRKVADQLKADEVMLLPFAHLFAEPAPVEPARDILEATAVSLLAAGLTVQRAPFGWFHTWDLRAKGHPLSRLARTIRPPAAED